MNTLSVTSTDAAGNVSGAATVEITQEDMPATPTITTPTQTTTHTSITVTGTAKAGNTVTITGGSATATGTADSSGNYSITVSLNTGVTNILYVMQTDTSGIVSASATVNITQQGVSSAQIISYTMTADSKFTTTSTSKSFTVKVSRDLGSAALTDGRILVVTTLAAGDQIFETYSLTGDTTVQKVTVDVNSAKCTIYLINGTFDGTSIPTSYALAVFIKK